MRRMYTNKNLKGLSWKEYNFSGYSTELQFPKDAENVQGIYYIGKLNDADHVIDYYELGFTYDILGTFNKYKKILHDKKEYYHVFFHEGDDNISLEDIFIDLNKEKYKKSLN